MFPRKLWLDSGHSRSCLFSFFKASVPPRPPKQEIDSSNQSPSRAPLRCAICSCRDSQDHLRFLRGGHEGSNCLGLEHPHKGGASDFYRGVFLQAVQIPPRAFLCGAANTYVIVTYERRAANAVARGCSCLQKRARLWDLYLRHFAHVCWIVSRIPEIVADAFDVTMDVLESGDVGSR